MLDVVLFAGLVVCALIAPYTKVEESFNVQGVHDLVFYGPWNLGAFDHFEFPGVVPRTFTGPLVLYAGYAPFGWTLQYLFPKLLASIPKVAYLIFVRILLGAGVSLSHAYLRSSVRQVFGPTVSFYMGLLTLSQFHLLFWGSRLLPNIFALVVVQMALGAWVRGFGLISLQLFVFSAVVFRCELALLGAPIILSDLIVYRRYSLKDGIKAFLVAFTLSLLWTLGIDSYFWQRPFFWPELQVFLFNTWKNGSVAYGVSPWHAYFTNLIPRMAPIGFLLSLGAMIVRPRGTLPILFPAIFFVGLYSLLPHKEWRFVIYVLPLMNTAGALLISQRSFPKAVRLIVVLSSFGLFSGAFIRALVSSFNYPGGEALRLLHSSDGFTENVSSVHIDTYTAMTGASRFLQSECPTLPWTYTGVKENYCYVMYNKSEALQDFSRFSHLVTHQPLKHSQSEWRVVSEIQGFTGINKDWKGYSKRILDGDCSGEGTRQKMLLCLVPIRTEPLIWIFERGDSTMKE